MPDEIPQTDEQTSGGEMLDSDAEKFLASCLWMRKNHVFAFILGLFTLGIPYAMAGIGGAQDHDVFPPLVSYWSNKKVKWVAAFALAGEIYMLGVLVFFTFYDNPWSAICLPFMAVCLLGIIEVGYQLFAQTDGFVLTHVYALNRSERSDEIRGPALLVSKFIRRMPTPAQPTLGLVWAWLLGFVFVATFLTGVYLVVMVGMFLLCCVVTVFIAGLILNALLGGGSSGGYTPPEGRPQSSPRLLEYPPIPFDGYCIRDQSGRVALSRVRGRIFVGKKQVGYLQGPLIFYYWTHTGEAEAVYELAGNKILDAEDGSLYATIDGLNIIAPDGTLRYTVSEVS